MVEIAHIESDGNGGLNINVSKLAALISFIILVVGPIITATVMAVQLKSDVTTLKSEFADQDIIINKLNERIELCEKNNEVTTAKLDMIADNVKEIQTDVKELIKR